MTWAKLDDQYFRHPKSRAAGKDGRALDLAAICYCSSALTDGFIATAALPLIAAEAEVRPSVARNLVEVGRWIEVIGGWEIHNYAQRQRTRDEVETEREATRSRVRKHRDRQRSNAVTPTVSNSVSNDVGNNVVTASEVDTETELPHQQPHWEPPSHPPVDDDTNMQVEPPLDPVDIKIRAVIDRCTDARMRGKTPSNPTAYRTQVTREFAQRTDELRAVIATHPTAPISTLAGWMLGEQNSLHVYREAS